MDTDVPPAACTPCVANVQWAFLAPFSMSVDRTDSVLTFPLCVGA